MADPVPPNLPETHTPGRPALFAAAAQWLSGCVAGAMDALRTSRERRRQRAAERWVRQWRNWMQSLAGPNPPACGLDFVNVPSMEPLRYMLLGRSRGEVAGLLGPPLATSGQPLPQNSLSYWHAEVWYYPLDLRRHHAVAVTFEHEVATSVERLAGPE